MTVRSICATHGVCFSIRIACSCLPFIGIALNISNWAGLFFCNFGAKGVKLTKEEKKRVYNIIRCTTLISMATTTIALGVLGAIGIPFASGLAGVLLIQTCICSVVCTR